MPMIKTPKSLAMILLLFAAGNVGAQEDATGTSAGLPDNEISFDIVNEDQIVPVSDEGIDESDEQSVIEDADEAALAQEFAHFKEAMDSAGKNRAFLDEADTIAKRVVELAISIKGPESNTFAKALTNLAIVQYHSKQYEAAQQNFVSAIEIIEENEDRLNAQLVNPLKGLGASQLESGRPDLASGTFRRAVHVTHVNEGPHNLDQTELLESLAETHLRMDDLDSAKQAQDTIYALNIRKHGLDSIDLVPSLMRRAAWQHRAGFIYDERATYRRAIRVIEKEADKNDLRLIAPLILLGKSFFFIDTTGAQTYQDTGMASGHTYFRRAVRIAEQHPESTWQVVAQATLALGDYYMFASDPQHGNQVYSIVWNLLSEDDNRLDVRREQLEMLVPLRFRSIPQYLDVDDADAGPQGDDPLLQGRISISYDVSIRGRATNVKLIESNPAEFSNMSNYVVREMRRRVYRPRFADAQPVATPGQILEHSFFYRQSDLDAAIAATKQD